MLGFVAFSTAHSKGQLQRPVLWLLLLLLVPSAFCVGSRHPEGSSSPHDILPLQALPVLTPDADVPPVFLNGAWDPSRVGGGGGRNAYIAAVLSKDVYVKHVIDPRDGSAARRNFSRFATQFCRSMYNLGADECEAVSGPRSLVWAVLRAGRSVLLVVRGSNTPQNWLADVASIRTLNVADLGGGPAGVNVAAGFYRVFEANRRPLVARVRKAMRGAAAAAAAAAEAAAEAAAGTTGAASLATKAAGPATRLYSSGSSSPKEGAGGDGGGGGGGGSSSNSSSGSGGSAAVDKGGARLWVLGHSLGGAVALMAAAHLEAAHGLRAAGVFTFGCPRTGDSSWAAAYRLADVTLRLDNTGDIIPGLPLGATWRHVGAQAVLQNCHAAPPPPQQQQPSQLQQQAAGEVLQQPLQQQAAPASSASAGGPQQEAQELQQLLLWRRGQLLRLQQQQDREQQQQEEGHMLPAQQQQQQERYEQQLLLLQQLQQLQKQLQDLQQQEKQPEQGVSQAVSFPVPGWLRDHMIQTYVHVMWNCLPNSERKLVPGPDDVYGLVYGKTLPYNETTVYGDSYYDDADGDGDGWGEVLGGGSVDGGASR
ncbi:hypothetical protein Agub_g9303 [Astrephomene gubernaculifera]|uniref:Fungal lipase-type domain-containing protein n=1 Tax=Astrephomene gubernaculifera TaxID=47775 RepID=A0AAD3DT53_9CHLO|nr:hypothetical protein Agub_g9303 [Astrephomene gubernaculifera]